jgi:hypothetical protein
VINHYLGKNRPKLQEKLQQKSGLIGGELPASRRFCRFSSPSKISFFAGDEQGPRGADTGRNFCGFGAPVYAFDPGDFGEL